MTLGFLPESSLLLLMNLFQLLLWLQKMQLGGLRGLLILGVPETLSLLFALKKKRNDVNRISGFLKNHSTNVTLKKQRSLEAAWHQSVSLVLAKRKGKSLPLSCLRLFLQTHIGAMIL